MVQLDQKTSAVETERNKLLEEFQRLQRTVRSQTDLPAHGIVETTAFLKRIENLLGQISTLQRTVDGQSKLVNSIETSIAWTMIVTYRRLRDQFFPAQSSRRRLYEVAKTIVNDMLKPKNHESNPDPQEVREIA